ncbi:oligosaccharide flippase family protein [Tropicimonas sp. TH_r6]|uniref:oligosaccharide flippase family protein n=1 Tax=Tropicimonas sp. TH_r6 TaxID=3082085 RepID=UPI002953C602|nr:oligosaccharide flippase family protein [Tropicimonas sp. TH_r6]MDV7141181.1 oligosaccharide flippase family protein [Tropicimonas sp. TH_r6]
MKWLTRKLIGSDIAARTRRGSLWTALDFGGNQILRLASNLLLTRLLFPEAFGLMAIVQVFLTGLQMFSDAGIQSAIVQNKRGDDPAFLDTAWSIQILRGALLWAVTFLIAGPVALLYQAPVLAEMLPWMGLSLFLHGFTPTAVHSAGRHLQLGRLTAINLGTFTLQIITACLLAWLLQSVWALVIAANLRALAGLVAHWRLLPEAQNRFRIETEALASLFHFGKYIFLSTAAGFVVSQSDRAILGLHIPMAELGIYNIGFFMAMMPRNFASSLQTKVIFPLYRLQPINESAANRARIFHARRRLAAAMIAAALMLAALGPWLVDLLYDPRYRSAGPMITLFSLSLIPLITLTTAGPMLLAMGDSRRVLVSQLLTAALQTGLLVLGIRHFGVAGAILAPGLACLLAAPLRVAYARRYKAWDPLQDLGMTTFGLLVAGAICAWHREAILTLLP